MWNFLDFVLSLNSLSLFGMVFLIDIIDLLSCKKCNYMERDLIFICLNMKNTFNFGFQMLGMPKQGKKKVCIICIFGYSGCVVIVKIFTSVISLKEIKR